MSHWTAAQKIRALELRREGLLIREIVAIVGVPKSTVTRWVTPSFEERQRKLARKRKYSKGKLCKRCRRKISNNATLCRKCVALKQHENRPWTREKVIAALQLWAADNGRAPVHREWSRSGPGHPATSSILRGPYPLFGSWSELLIEAGFTPRERRAAKKLTRQERQALRRNVRETKLKKAIKEEEGKQDA